MYTIDEIILMNRLQEVANERFDGHLSILKFTTNWRVSFGTPSWGHEDIQKMAVGKTFGEAALKTLEEFREQEEEQQRLHWRDSLDL